MPSKVTAWGREAQAGEIGVSFLNECSARRKGITLAGNQAAFYIHVDDGALITAELPSRGNRADKLANFCADALAEQGFVVTDRTSCTDIKKYVGYEHVAHPA